MGTVPPFFWGGTVELLLLTISCAKVRTHQILFLSDVPEGTRTHQINKNLSLLKITNKFFFLNG